MTTLENLVKTFLVKYINYVYIKLKLMQKLKFKTKFMLENKKFSFPEYIKIKFTIMKRKRTIKDVDDDIMRTLERINILLSLKIYLMRMKLALLDMMINKYMKMYNGNIKELKIMYQNIPGTLSNYNLIATIQSLLDRHQPDVLALAEPSTNDLEIDWYPYVLVPGKIQNGKNIRLNVLVRANVNFKVSYWRVEIPHAVISILDWSVVFAYREWAKCGEQSTRPLQMQLDRWTGFVERWSKEKGKKKMVIGDLNFDYYSTDGFQKQMRPIRSLVLDNIIQEGWYQLIREPTRYQNLSSSCLDHVYTRSVADIKSVMNQNETGYDHNCVGVVINTSKHLTHPQVVQIRDVEGIKMDDFIQTFSDLDLAGIWNMQNSSEAAELLTHSINVTLNKLAPLKKRIFKMRTSAHWMTPEIRERIKQRNMMRVMAVKMKSEKLWHDFKQFRNRLKSDMLQQKRKWIRSQLTRENQDPKARWRAIKSATEGKRNVNDIVLNANGKILCQPEEVANHLNAFYIKKVSDIRESNPPDPDLAVQYVKQYVDTLGRDLPEFNFACVTQYEVAKIIANLKSTGATGHDQISTHVIKKFAQVLIPYITKVINLSIMTSNYPQIWKHGVISPVPKKGDLSLDKNWRPVTLLPILSKILEAVLNSQLKHHMEENRILGPSQHAYRKYKSTHTAWADLDARIQKATDSGRFVGLLILI